MPPRNGMGVPHLLNVEPVDDSDGGSPSARRRCGEGSSPQAQPSPMPRADGASSSSEDLLSGDPFEGCEDIVEEGMAEWVGDFEARGSTPSAALAQDACTRLPLSDCRRSAAPADGKAETVVSFGRLSLETGSTASRCEGSAAPSLWAGSSSCSSPSRVSRCSGLRSSAASGARKESACSTVSGTRKSSSSTASQACSSSADGLLTDRTVQGFKKCQSAGLGAGSQDSLFPGLGMLPLAPMTFRAGLEPKARASTAGVGAGGASYGGELRPWGPRPLCETPSRTSPSACATPESQEPKVRVGVSADGGDLRPWRPLSDTPAKPSAASSARTGETPIEDAAPCGGGASPSSGGGARGGPRQWRPICQTPVRTSLETSTSSGSSLKPEREDYKLRAADGTELRPWRPLAGETPSSPSTASTSSEKSGREEQAAAPLGHFLQSCLAPVHSTLFKE